MRAIRINHVSVHATDLDASERFYREVFGMEPIPTPHFGYPVRWLRVGDMQLHLFQRTAEPPLAHHFALTVDDLEAAYRRAADLVILDRPEIRRLPDGSAQMYIRDPAGNLVELNAPDADGLDQAVVGPLVRLTGEPGARLFL
ncbi:MAG: VOC family protein [Candidatus Dormibacteraeota bacterium]|nr:VOC family protein [Candidatus Dormibacteraeota bacterium]